MAAGHPRGTETFELPSRDEQPSADRGYLLVVREGSSSIFRLPHTGIVLVGRAEEAELRIDDRSISREHARLFVTDGEVRISDLGSRNGTAVNGQRLDATRQLIPGDVITLGTVTLVLHGGGHLRPERAPLSLEQLRRRVAEELGRALHYERPTAVAALELAAPPDSPVQVADAAHAALRPHDVLAWASPAQLLVLMPELGEEEAREEVQGLLARVAERAGGDVRAGLASCPADGADAETLLYTARAAAAAASPGTVGTAAHLVTRTTLRGHTLVLADPAMHGLYALIQRLAVTDLPVLITGETGTGKELAASAVHFHSRRSDRPFVTLNCAALQDTLVESELFGYERGAFSGATNAKSGLLEAASGGTVFLDEIGELSLAGQAKLLRAVETQRITRLGDVRERSIDIRIVAATNRDLHADVRAGRFRQDLLFRLGAATVMLPALRDRPREIPILARTFLEEACARAGRPPIALSVGALQKLVASPWPGNVRELRNVLHYCAAIVEGDLLEAWHLPERGEPAAAPAPRAPAEAPAPPAGAAAPAPRRLEEELRELERRRMVEALEACGGVQKHAAQRIGMPLRTFVLKVKQYGLGRGGQSPR